MFSLVLFITLRSGWFLKCSVLGVISFLCSIVCGTHWSWFGSSLLVIKRDSINNKSSSSEMFIIGGGEISFGWNITSSGEFFFFFDWFFCLGLEVLQLFDVSIKSKFILGTLVLRDLFTIEAQDESSDVVDFKESTTEEGSKTF